MYPLILPHLVRNAGWLYIANILWINNSPIIATALMADFYCQCKTFLLFYTLNCSFIHLSVCWLLSNSSLRITKTTWSSLVLGDMVIFHIVISPACEIADTQYYRAWVGVGKRETLCTCHKQFHNYLVILNRACVREREPGSTNNRNNILSNILKN